MLLQYLQELQSVLVAEYAQSSGMFGELARIELRLAETYRNRIQYELLQNSDDAASTEVNVTVSSDGLVNWTNNGEPFNNANAEAICRSASTSKTDSDAIGYRGIGFKSLAAVASHIEVRSAGASFSFDRDDAIALLSAQKDEITRADIPLIRIPSRLSAHEISTGASFVVTPKSSSTNVLGVIEPHALLFLRHIESLSLNQNGSSEIIRVDRQDGKTCLVFNGNEARFAVLTTAKTSIAIPLDETALSLCTLRGRLACYLPLEDSLGLPLIASGAIMTDPSRTHAVVGDDSTRECLREAAHLFASQLVDPTQECFQRAWELLTMADDPRSILVSESDSADGVFFESLREYFRSAELPFTFSPITIAEKDLAKVFPTGAPRALYRHENLTASRALRIALALPTMDVAKSIKPIAEEVTGETLGAAREYVRSLVSAMARQPNEDEQFLIGVEPPQPAVTQPQPAPISPEQRAEFPEMMATWRKAEVAVQRFLNSRGWHLEDVSRQNLGYDLVGLSSDNDRVMIEVKRVSRPNESFSMTNNEMGAKEAEQGRYLLAIVIGEDSHAQLVLLDPKSEAIKPERVCRAWEWRFIDWFRHGTLLS